MPRVTLPARFTLALAALMVVACAGIASATAYNITWLDMSPTPVASNFPSGSSFNVPGIGVGQGRIADYDASVAAAAAEFPPTPHAAPATDQLLVMSKDPAALASGKTVFGAYCVACHGPDGGGVIGPNLTDTYWIHGGSPAAIYTTVHDGVLAKGMPAWGLSLKPEEVDAVVAYVISLQGTTPATPKPPEGTVDSAAAAPPSGS